MIPDLKALVEKWKREAESGDVFEKCILRECAEELDAALAAGGTLRESCTWSPVSSAVCALGRRGCDVQHALAVERGTAPEKEQE